MNFDDHYRYINITELTATDNQYCEHIDCNIQLKPHQLVMLNKCIEREKKQIRFDVNDVHLNNRYDNMKCDIGVIADKVGSGKSFVILSLIASKTIPSDSFKINSAFGHGHLILESKEHILIDKNINILVIPHMLLKQWTKYVEMFSKNIKYYVVNKKRSLENLEKEIDNRNLIIVTGTFYKYVRGIFYINKWRASRVFFDEVDSTNTPSAHYFPCKFIWFVTASYKNLLFPIHKVFYDRRNISNSYILSNGISNNAFAKKMFVDMIKIMSDSELRALDKIIIKNEDTFVDSSFNLPNVIQNVIMCRSPVEVDILRGLVSRDIINCLNAGDIQSATGYINQANLDSETNIINKALSDLHNNMINLSVRQTAVENLIYSNEDQRNSALKKIVEEKNSIEEKILLMRKRIEETKLCTICYNDTINKCISKCCKNVYCLECISKWLMVSKICPICKSTVNIQEDFYVVNKNGNQSSLFESKQSKYDMYKDKLPGDDEYTKSLNKFDNLERIISQRSSTSKFLIFSDFEQSFHHMYPYLKKSELKYAQIKGNAVDNIVSKYKGNELDALLVNSRNYGSGLNLENTTDVILFHKFEDQLEKQIIGRAQRPGRTNSLKVWYLLNENEMHVDA